MHKKYWLRTGLALAIIFFVYSLFLDWLYQTGAPISAEFHKVLYQIGYPFVFVRFVSIGFQDSFSALIIGDTIAFAVFFLLGALIGWIYGKIKKNRSK